MRNLFKRVSALIRFGWDKPIGDDDRASIERIELIETGLGNEILESLKDQGWVVTRQYSPLAFDKGIDFDWYTLRKDSDRVDFEWTNWLEWTIKGDQQVIADIGRIIDKQTSQ